MQPKYEVPIIPPNLRREETIVQIAEAINYLLDVSNDIFNRVNERVAANRAQISRINDRISTANTKLLKLSGAKKATQVFSSSKYPAADLNRPYVSIMDGGEVLPVKKFKVRYKNIPIKDEPLETLQFYHVKVPKKKVKEDHNGLGKIPSDIDMVNDLLLYNSGKNLYSNYTLSDSLNVLRTSRKEVVKDINEIAAAPISLSDRGVPIRNVGETYFYSPDLGNVPTIDVPLDLPDLPGVADDLRYITNDGPGIAPSVTNTPNIPDLPPIQTSEEELPQVEKIYAAPVHVEEQPKTLEVQLPVEVENLSLPTTINSEPTTTLSDTTDTSGNIDSSRGSSVKVIEISDSRASLMEAIRNAGGSKKLKSTDVKKNEKVSMSGGDLMADLHLKLSMRRKGISGANVKDQNIDSKSTMGRISAMIPPPPTKNDSELSEDDEWDD